LAFLGHLDLVRLLARCFRRAQLPVAHTRGFSPKPRMTFSPALSLGIPSLGELLDVDIEAGLAASEVRERLASVCPEGIEIVECTIAAGPGLGKAITAFDLAIRPAPDGIAHDPPRLARICRNFLDKSTAPLQRDDRIIDARALVAELDVIEDAAKLCAALDWPDGPLLRARVRVTSKGSIKPIELVKALGVWGDRALIARLGLIIEVPAVVGSLAMS
jgi:radical SAM-linked protein